MLKRTMIIVAGGSGTRMGGDVPKQFLLLKGKPLLMHTLTNLHSMDGQMHLVLVLPEEHCSTWKNLCEQHGFQVPHTTVAGGETRFRSVQNGLAEVHGADLVGVHDGVRPFAAKDVVERCFEMANDHGAAIPVTPIVQSLRSVESERSEAVDRSVYRAVQTPQCFRAAVILDAYANATHDRFTDDASVVEASGHEVFLVDGNTENIKVTTPLDLKLAELLIS